MYHSLIQVLSAAKLIGRLSGATIDEIEDKLGISRRSVYRVLETLEDLGYPYYKDEEHGNRYRLVDAGKPTQWWMPLPSVSFDLEDRVLLDYLFDSAARDPAIASGVRALREKMSFIGASAGYALAPKESGAGPLTKTVHLLSASSIIKASSPKVEKYMKVFLEAAKEKRVCELAYESRESGSVKTYPVHPLALFESEGGLYCYVEVPRHGSIIIIALERVREVKVLDQTFQPPKDFDPEKRLADPFGIVQGEVFAAKLVFSEEQAPYVRDLAWPETYRFEDLPDGRLAMSFETGGAFGLKRWILSWGSNVEVVEPDWLRTEMKEEISAMRRTYAKK